MTTRRVLAISDEVDPTLGPDAIRRLRPDLVVSCGDLPFDYLERVAGMVQVPLLFVPGNHDPAPPGRSRLGEFSPAMWFVPFDREAAHRLYVEGCTDVDGRVMTVAGITVAGLGGSHRYNQGPNQYTQREMNRRAGRLVRTARRLGQVRGGRGRVDLLITHAAPSGLGDGEDACHQGFTVFRDLVEKLGPQVHAHGHIHPYGQPKPDRRLNGTRIVNCIPYRLIEIDVAAEGVA
jgi:uncharacterized protein